jgi:hypothetical protein
MVRAILEGRKTQTRRIMKPQIPAECGIRFMLGNESWLPEDQRSPLRYHAEAWGGPLYQNRPEKYLCGIHTAKFPYGRPGDRLWIRETFCPDWTDHPIYKADGGSAREAGYSKEPKWRPSIHMPRNLSRIDLEITGVRVERLQDISVEDAKAEGLEYREGMWGIWNADGSMRCGGGSYPVEAFRCLWININGNGSWNNNPFVWVIEFKRMSQNDDLCLNVIS